MSNNDLYDRKISSKIKLKGINKLYKKKKRDSENEKQTSDKTNSGESVKVIIGTGRIVSSGSTIQGFETKFVEEVSVNDKIVIEHPLTHGTEEKVVQSVISNRTLTVDEPFSADLITTIPFTILKIPSNEDDQDGRAAYTVLETKKELSTISVREKTGMWTYKTVTKTVKGNLTAEDRLNERVKQGRDKYCW